MTGNQMVSTHTDPLDLIPALMSPLQPHVIVLFGGAGDLARRKLLPGLMHLWQAGLLPECGIVGTSLEAFDDDGFRAFARVACDEFSAHGFTDAEWSAFGRRISYVAQDAGPDGLAAAVAAVEVELGGEPRRLHYLSVPPNAARAVIATLDQAGLVARSRIVMEKPFGMNLATSKTLNALLHATFDEEQIFRIDHFLGKEAAQNILAFGSPTVCSSPSGTATTSITCRSTCPRPSRWRNGSASTSRLAPTGTWW